MTEKSFNPAPLGLMGFGITTILLNLVNAGLLRADALGMVLPMGIFYGGLAQVVAGLLEARQRNTFGATAEILNETYGKSILPTGRIGA